MHENFLCILFRNPRIENTKLFFNMSVSFSQNIFCTYFSHENNSFLQKLSCTHYSHRKFSVHNILIENFLQRLALQKNVCLLSSQVSIYAGVHIILTEHFLQRMNRQTKLCFLSRREWIQLFPCTLFMHCIYCLHCIICLLVIICIIF